MAQPPTRYTRSLSALESWAWDRCARFQADIREAAGIQAADRAHEAGAEWAQVRIVDGVGPMARELAVFGVDARPIWARDDEWREAV